MFASSLRNRLAVLFGLIVLGAILVALVLVFPRGIAGVLDGRR